MHELPGRQIPEHVGEAEGESADAHVAEFVEIHQVDVARHLDAGRVRICVAGQPKVEAAAFAFLLEPELAGGVEEVGLVFEEIAVPRDDLAAVAVPETLEADGLLRGVEGLDLRGERRAHDDAPLAPDDAADVVLGLSAQMLRVDAQMHGGVADFRLVLVGPPLRLLPRVPVAHHVFGVRDGPVRRAGERDANDLAVGGDAPDGARGEVEVGDPDFAGFGDVGAIGSELPCGHAFRAGYDGFAGAPGGIDGETDRARGGADEPAPQRAAVGDAPFEDEGVGIGADLGVAGGGRVERMPLPRRCGRTPIARIVAALEVDVARIAALIGGERHRRPLEIARGQHLGVGLLPGVGGHGRRGGRAGGGNRQRGGDQAKRHLFADGGHGNSPDGLRRGGRVKAVVFPVVDF